MQLQKWSNNINKYLLSAYCASGTLLRVLLAITESLREIILPVLRMRKQRQGAVEQPATVLVVDPGGNTRQ